MRADLGGLQVGAAYGQQRVPAGLGNVVENVAFGKQGEATIIRRMSYWGLESIYQ